MAHNDKLSASQDTSTSSPPSTPSTPTKMQLDLSSLPPLIQPSPPSNTLLITQLTNPSIFLPSNLQQIHALLSQHAGAPLQSFSPLKSMRRIIISLPSTEAAIALRRTLDGEFILGCRVRVYFGAHTTIESGDQHLKAPDTGRLFFISPPPSPPLGWTVRHEDPPNKEVHAEDLASALAKLSDRGNGGDQDVAPVDWMDEEDDLSVEARRCSVPGSGSTATLVYSPVDHGGRGDLPAVMVEDVSGYEPVLEGKRIATHTARPPVELMLDDGMDTS